MLLAAILILVVATTVEAGGPKYVAGSTYFNSGTMGTPLTWAQGQINYYTDQGDLSPILPNAQANAFVADAFGQWTSISTAAVAATHAGQLAENVSGQNVYVNPDGTITMPADIMPTATGTPVGIVYDEDGTVTDALLGQGAGDSSACFYNAAYGGDDNYGTDATFLHALVVINGNCAQSSSQLADVEYRLVRVLGQVLGLDWSQLNLNVLTGDPPPTPDDYAGFPVMHAVDPPNCIPITLCYPTNPYLPKTDDQAALSRLYPVTEQNKSRFPGKRVFSGTTARIYGRVSFADASGLAAQAMQGVNVVARWINPSTGKPSGQYAAASVSGFLFSGNAGNTVTGFYNSAGQPFSQYGSNDTTVEGFFDLGGLPIPNGTTAQYQLTVEAEDPLWSIGMNPYGDWPVPPSGSSAPITVNENLGGNVEQDVLMLNSAAQAAAPFPPTSYANPAAVPAGGTWQSALSPYADLDYFWFSGQTNRTLSVLVTALDNTGAPSESEALPVIGMWALSDPPVSPAPANTPSAFNTNNVGMTILNAQLLATTDFRVGISDFRGDGRPDYGYQARILYGDHLAPTRAGVAGGTPISIVGLGFEGNTATSINDRNAPPLAISASQIEVIAPAQPDGLANVALIDPPTQASSLLTGALIYGAGPDDKIKLMEGVNPGTPVGAQAPNPVEVQVLQADGLTPVPGASVVFTAAPAVSFTACSGATSCTILSDQGGFASTFVTPLSAGVASITIQLAPASYSAPKQVQATLLGTSSSLDIGLAPQYSSIAIGTSLNVPIKARVISNGVGQSGRTVNFQVVKGSANLSATVVTTDSNGYAATTVEISLMSGGVQVNACVGPNNAPCVSFYGMAVPASGLQLQAVSGNSQAVVEAQTPAPVVTRVVDFSTPPVPVIGAAVLIQATIERTPDPTSISGGDTNITQPPTPTILSTSQSWLSSDVNGLVSFQPSTGGFSGALDILGAAAAGISTVPFSVEVLPPLNN